MHETPLWHTLLKCPAGERWVRSSWWSVTDWGRAAGLFARWRCEPWVALAGWCFVKLWTGSPTSDVCPSTDAYKVWNPRASPWQGPSHPDPRRHNSQFRPRTCEWMPHNAQHCVPMDGSHSRVGIYNIQFSHQPLTPTDRPHITCERHLLSHTLNTNWAEAFKMLQWTSMWIYFRYILTALPEWMLWAGDRDPKRATRLAYKTGIPGFNCLLSKKA